MSAVSFIVGRMHVGASDTEVVREIARRAKRSKLPKAERKALYRQALEEHHANRQMYDHVMRGRF